MPILLDHNNNPIECSNEAAEEIMWLRKQLKMTQDWDFEGGEYWTIIGKFIEDQGSDKEKIALMLCRGQAAEWRYGVKEK